MKNKIEIAIQQAKKYLNRPRDITHDLIHHESVWENCQIIIKREKLSINFGLMKVAAFWHDVILTKPKKSSLENVEEDVNFLRKFLPSIGFDEKETKIILESVTHHEFRDSPTNIEGMVLQDADKLDVLSKSRWDRTMEAFKSGEMSREKYVSYLKTGLKWIPILESTFHFKYSRKIAHESVKDIFSNERQVEMINKVGLEKELSDSKKAMNSFETKIKRLFISIMNIKIKVLVYLKSFSQ